MSSDLWHFAEQLYSQPGVEAACLELQEHGADVCLLLCGTWLGVNGVECSAERAAQLRAMSQPWQEQVVSRLRGVRQDWRARAFDDPQLKALREQVKQLELQAERIQLERLAGLATQWPRSDQPSVGLWLTSLSAPLADSGRAAQDLLCDSATALARL
ncbi:MAG: TIGR02444 family protein [Pseudomonadaceae bacterium]|nr:TIGR02444 family protein [Pseudomonadaceae bacterium]|tara:strand:+ start:523 stop:996 length:474 start_codon:yes stop_codon:yes gene_type:complete